MGSVMALPGTATSFTKGFKVITKPTKESKNARN